jgi:hypothetical protein
VRGLFLAGAVLTAGCGSFEGTLHDVDAGPDATTSSSSSSGSPTSVQDAGTGEAQAGLPECTAQRSVHLVGGFGGLAWFTLVWPLPAVIEGYVDTYAYDDPARAMLVPSTRSLYARSVAGQPLWTGTGKAPQVTAMVAGKSQAHQDVPTMTMLGVSPDRELLGVAAIRQQVLGAPMPVLRFVDGGFLQAYGPEHDAPTAADVASIDEAIDALRHRIPIRADVELELRSTANRVSQAVTGDSPQAVRFLAIRLALTAALFRFGFTSSVLLPAFHDDPHDAFATANRAATTATADSFAAVLDAFYRELADHPDPACVVNGAPVPLSDNVLLLVTGDTPKNSFVAESWPDASPNSSNLVYVRSNGWLAPGWFGSVTASIRRNFNPTTGELDDQVGAAADQRAAMTATLFAIARGDAAFVTSLTAQPYAGVLAP